jgi:hypothetical protein
MQRAFFSNPTPDVSPLTPYDSVRDFFLDLVRRAPSSQVNRLFDHSLSFDDVRNPLDTIALEGMVECLNNPYRDR